MTDKAGTRDDVEQLNRVQQKQQRAKDRAMWHSEQELCESRQLAFVGDLLTAFVEERPDPCDRISTNTERLLESLTVNDVLHTLEHLYFYTS